MVQRRPSRRIALGRFAQGLRADVSSVSPKASQLRYVEGYCKGNRDSDFEDLYCPAARRRVPHLPLVGFLKLC